MASLVFSPSALQHWLRPERSGQIARLFNVLLVAWLAWQLAKLGLQLFPDPESAAPQALSRVGDPGGREAHYSIGDSLPGNARLAGIYADRIMLDRSGHYETLRLPRDLTAVGDKAAVSSNGTQSQGSGDVATISRIGNESG
jgi:hypothetical protein